MHGAMENYGLLTFSTKRIMYNSSKNGMDIYRRVIQIVAHELAHQVSLTKLAHTNVIVW